MAYDVIVSIYMYSICFATGMTPCQTLYAVECLENHTRAKGTSLKFLAVNIAMIVNTYEISVGMEEIGWKLYFVYIVWITMRSSSCSSSRRREARHWRSRRSSLRRQIRERRARGRQRCRFGRVGMWSTWTKMRRLRSRGDCSHLKLEYRRRGY